ncbi:MAG: hypothetical protein ACM3PZ_00195 [Bacillota bacterium]
MDKKKKNLSRGILIGSGLIFFLSILIFNSYSYSDSDLGWHLRVGNDILDSGQAPRENFYNFTLQRDWIDHEWLLNAGMAGVTKLAGFGVLHLLFALVALTAVALAVWHGAKKNSLGYAFLLGVLAVWASRPHLGLRVQEFGLLFSVVIMYVITWVRPKHFLYIMPTLFLLWSNFHGSFLLGLALLGAYTVYLWLVPLVRRISQAVGLPIISFTNRDRWFITASWVMSLAATLINPYGFRLYGLLAGYTNTSYMGYIQEWLGQYSLPLYYPQLAYLALVSALATWHIYRWREVKRGTLWEYGVFIIFYILAWRSRRHFPLFALITLPLCTLFLEDIFSDLPKLGGQMVTRLRVLAAISLAGLSIILLVKIPYGLHPILAYCGQKYPCAAVEYLESLSQVKSRRIFNEFNWGGFLLYSAPELDYFIDGRMPQERYGNRTILEEYRALRYGFEDIGAAIEKHGIDTAIIYSSDRTYQYKKWERIFFNIKDSKPSPTDNLREYFDGSPLWSRVYFDGLASIYEKTE